MEIKKWKDFPQPGVTYIDINNILQNPEFYSKTTFKMTGYVNATNPNGGVILSPESRGHLFSSVIAKNLNLPLIQLRKEGKYPKEESIEIDYNTEYEEGGKIFAPIYNYQQHHKFYVIDDVCATGKSFEGISNFIRAQVPDAEVFYVTAIDLTYLHSPIENHIAPLIVENIEQIEYIER